MIIKANEKPRRTCVSHQQEEVDDKRLKNRDDNFLKSVELYEDFRAAGLKDKLFLLASLMGNDEGSKFQFKDFLIVLDSFSDGYNSQI